MALSPFPCFVSFCILATAYAATIPSSPGNATVCDNQLCTWWHDDGEVNVATMVQPGNVRQSRQYLVSVSKAGQNQFSSSFVYEAIPRNGRGQIYSPWDPPIPSTYVPGTDDGITIEISAGINMAWSQFEYGTDVVVKIQRRDGTNCGATGEVTIRPTDVRYNLTSSGDGGLIISVPFDPNGRKFSVEFASDLYTYRSNGTNYISSGGSVAGIEPRNALMIFASPFLPSSLIPAVDGPDTKIMKPGPINEGDWGSSGVLYFPPGVYWMNSNARGDTPRLGEDHIKLTPSTYWVYLAPGAFVKGAISYNTTKQDFYATGHGILSGEHYVYQANPMMNYQGNKSDQDSLRMWYHTGGSSNQRWHCIGPTISSPPFNTMDFRSATADSGEPATTISDYKQVGAFFFQTDGPQMYTGSEVTNVFYHVNDDAIKTYYSGVRASNLTVWKVHNDPIFQMGWSLRNVSNVTIDSLSVVHTRCIKSEMGVPSSIIGASPFYADGQIPSADSVISLTITNLRCEGSCPGLIRLSPVGSYKDFIVRNVSFPDGLRTDPIGVGQSIILPQPDANIMIGLNIENWTVAGQRVTMDNYLQLGQFNISSQYAGQWRIS